MTDNQQKTWTVFEARVRQLMFMFDTLRVENAELRVQLDDKEKQCRQALDEVKVLNVKYNNLKIARIISIKQDDLKGARQRISKLVREVDKCIALLNE